MWCVCIYTHTYTYNGILISHKKKHIWFSSNEMDETWACYTEWNKSEIEKKYHLLMHIY